MSRGASGRPVDPLEASQPRQAPGEAATTLAAGWYEAHGFEVLERHWRRREGELDLIVRRGRTVVFCELRVGGGTEPVLEARQRRIRRLASRWLSELTPAVGRSTVDVRFDVASITDGAVEVAEDAM